MRILFVAYDNDSYIGWFPQGLAYIATVCRNAGCEVKIYNQDVYHWDEDHLTRYLDNEQFDVIGVSVIAGYYQYKKLLSLSKAINASKNRPYYILGGHGPAPEPEFFLKKTSADLVVRGEGERTMLEIIEALKNKSSLFGVSGVAYMENGRCVITPERALIQELDSIQFPAWDLFPIDHYALSRMPNIKKSDRCLPVLSGRGCTFTCNFCYRMDKGFRARSVENIIEEISILQKDYHITSVVFSDELLMSSVKRTEEICNGFLKAKLKVRWSCNGRLNYAKKNLLKLMKDAGCVFINYGIESLEEKALKAMNKALTVKQIHEGIENTLAIGISPGFNIIFGNISETKETLMKGVDFLLKYDDHSQLRTIRPVTPYPGSPLYYYAIQKGLLKDCEEFYGKKHLNSDLLSVNFTDLSDDEFHAALLEANKILINAYIENLKKNINRTAEELYLKKDASFRGFRQI